MNIVNRIIIENKIGDREYRFECAMGSPWVDLQNFGALLHNLAAQKVQEEEAKVKEILPGDLRSQDECFEQTQGN